ncbi:MAG: ribulokinase [Armatimonadia bacterium]|nr:ribulokinase [Armatimonadia bacterium]
MPDKKYAIGLDYGTNSVRALIVDLSDGTEVASHVHEYQSGEAGIILDPASPHLARQNPRDYLTGLEDAVRMAVAKAEEGGDFCAADIIGIGVDTTGSTPIPVDAEGTPLSFKEEFGDNPNAMAWLWKDHTSVDEAEAITAAAAKLRPQYLAKCGGTYSSEWFWSKIWHCLKVDREVFDAAASWVEFADWVPAVLAGETDPKVIKRSVCAAGHKAMYSEEWGGLPDREFLAGLDPALGELRPRLYDEAVPSNVPAGELSKDWASRLGLKSGIPICTGAFDAHHGAVGAGVAEGTLVKIIGTSTCDVAVWPSDRDLADIPGVCGIVDGSVIPGMYGIEAGQSAVGDIFNWFVSVLCEGDSSLHEKLTEEAGKLAPGESGLLALDWNNGNRTILVDARLTGLLLGQTLRTTRAEVYRALIEATAFGARMILDRMEEYGVTVERVVNCGGIAEKNPMLMQIYADVTGRTMLISRSGQTCALGAAMFGAVCAGPDKGGYATIQDAQAAMCGVKETTYEPIPENREVYQELFELYRRLHDTFGLSGHSDALGDVMKKLLEIRSRVVG